eukprot:TRINITY_DN19728_c0_g1_i1.p1 TRINITY_DN19728_c0_g1~~TRINITY_DN19728_c0_g1_i1.p1  ORF type:complete len:307 (+),score=50.33 TRINITY_DN19728_c0_g1_i1:157-1077(+)
MASNLKDRRKSSKPLLALALVAVSTAVSCSFRCFVTARWHSSSATLLRNGGRDSHVASKAAGITELSDIGGGAGFQGSDASLWTTFLLFAVGLPGVYSTIQRTGQAKYVEKTYVMPGTADGGLDMRSIAGGVVAYFRNLNYGMEDSKQKGKIRFTGNMEGSVSQALYLTLVLLGTLIALGFVLQTLLPAGPFDLGPNFWFVPIIASPYAGWYYWGRAFRKDIVELSLQMSEDAKIVTLAILGDKETIETLQAGVRFQSPATGQLFQLAEPGMEYQPGIFESNKDAKVVRKQEDEKAPSKEVVAEAA